MRWGLSPPGSGALEWAAGSASAAKLRYGTMDVASLRAKGPETWPEIYKRSIVWDAHSCMPIKANQDLSGAERHRRAGASFLSLNVGMDFNPLGQCIRVIAGFRDYIRKHADRFILAETVDDVRRAK